MSRDVLLGIVVGAQGLRGEVKVKTFTALPQDLAAYGTLRTKDGRILEIASLRPSRPAAAIVHFKGVNDRAAAEALRNVELYIARSSLSAPAQDEFYHADLVGLRAEDANGSAVGEVRAIYNFGAGDVLEIVRGNGDALLLPFTRELVPTIDLAGGRLVVAAPEESGRATATGTAG